MTFSKIPLATRILVGLLFGAGAGLVAGPKAAALGVVGKVYIDLIKMMAIPLVFLSITDAVISTTISWRSAGRWLLIIAVNTSLALMLGLAISNTFRPGDGFLGSARDELSQAPVEVALPSLASVLDTVVPNSIIQPFADNNVLSVVLCALLVGAAVRRYRKEKERECATEPAFAELRGALSVLSIMLLWLVQLVPLAVLCVTAKTVGEHGFAPFRNLTEYVLLGCLGMAVQSMLVYSAWIWGVARVPLGRFLRAAKKPVVYAFGTNSSLATLPLTLDALDELGVSKGASRLGACIGTNFNNDGILLYEAMAVLFVAQAYGIELSLGQQAAAAAVSLVAAIGVAGVPEAGVVSLSLVLSAVGLPLEFVPLLLTVDWIVARMRSVTNVLSDMTVSAAIDGLSSSR